MGELVRLPGWEIRFYAAAERSNFRNSDTNDEWRDMEMRAWKEQSEALREERDNRKPVL